MYFKIVIIVFIIATISMLLCSYSIFRKDKNKRRKPFKTLVIFCLINIIDIPFIINELYKMGSDINNPYITMWSAADLLSFYGSFIAFVGTVSLGVLALWQNKIFKAENDISQQKLEAINTKLLDLDIKREKEKLLKLYFVYMEENQKIYDPLYVLDKVQQLHNQEELYNKIQQCKSNALRVKRRLLFIDNSCSDNSFFSYCDAKMDEILKIVMQNTDIKEIIKQLFEFWKSNSEEFNSKSLRFIIETNRSLIKEEK